MAETFDAHHFIRVTFVFPFALHESDELGECVGWTHPTVHVNWQAVPERELKVVVADVTRLTAVIAVTAPAIDVCEAMKTPEAEIGARSFLHWWIADGENRPAGPAIPALAQHVRELFEELAHFRQLASKSGERDIQRTQEATLTR